MGCFVVTEFLLTTASRGPSAIVEPLVLANGVQRIKTHEHVKFWQNRSIGYEYTKIFQFLPRDSYAKRGICHHLVSVCLCVGVSVTLRYCIKTAKRRITQITPHDSPLTLFSDTKVHWEIRKGSPPTGARNAGGVG